MYRINFSNPIKVHFIGIGGISMSGLAEILHMEDFTVTGSDMKESDTTRKLESLGIQVYYGHRPSNISDDTDLVVYTAAIKPDNEEYQTVIDKNIPLIDRAELLGQIMACYNYSIAVSGTHGKTTTTSMISQILLQGKLDPTITVGGILDSIHGNIHVGKSEYFITEACEYHNSFLKFNPKIGIILNVEADHLDFFKDIDDIRKSFKDFANKIPQDGLLIINGDIHNKEYFTNDIKCKVISYGLKSKDNNYTANNIEFDYLAHGQYDLVYNGEIIDKISLNVAGMHNVHNSLSAIAIARELNIPMDVIKLGLQAFGGTKRRFEYKGNVAGVTVIDDYAHHPTEIKATLDAAKKFTHENLWCVFQPHTYTRTKAFLKEFASSLSLSDKIILTDIYAAREKNPGDIHSKDLLNELNKLGKEAYYFESFDEIENFLLLNCREGDMLITMGAGDVKIIGETLLGD